MSYSGHVYCSSSFSVSFFINAELNSKSLLYWTLLWTCLQLEVAALLCLHRTRIYQLIYTGSSGFSWANPLFSPNKDDMTFFFQVPLPGEVIEISCGLDHMAAIIRLTWISLPFCDLHVDGLIWDNSREKCKEVTNESLQLMLYKCQRHTWLQNFHTQDWCLILHEYVLLLVESTERCFDHLFTIFNKGLLDWKEPFLNRTKHTLKRQLFALVL